MRVVSVPDGPYQDHLDDIVQCEYEEIADGPMLEPALESQIDHPNTHLGQGDVWFKHVDDKGFCGLWEPGNLPGMLRFAPVFTMPAHRGQGIGRAMVLKRFYYGLDRPDIVSMDTYAHNPMFFHQLGFEYVKHWEEKGTYYLIYDKD